MIKRIFKVFQFVVTGKIRGGKFRTETLKVGFGSVTRQILSFDLNYNYSCINAKEGSFGVRFVTVRRDSHRTAAQEWAES